MGDFYCLQPIVVKKNDKDDLIKKMGNNYPYSENKCYMEVVEDFIELICRFIMNCN